MSSIKNCGGCGVHCGANQQCTAGVCATCPTNTTFAAPVSFGACTGSTQFTVNVGTGGPRLQPGNGRNLASFSYDYSFSPAAGSGSTGAAFIFEANGFGSGSVIASGGNVEERRAKLSGAARVASYSTTAPIDGLVYVTMTAGADVAWTLSFTRAVDP